MFIEAASCKSRYASFLFLEQKASLVSIPCWTEEAHLAHISRFLRVLLAAMYEGNGLQASPGKMDLGRDKEFIAFSSNCSITTGLCLPVCGSRKSRSSTLVLLVMFPKSIEPSLSPKTLVLLVFGKCLRQIFSCLLLRKGVTATIARRRKADKSPVDVAGIVIL